MSNYLIDIDIHQMKAPKTGPTDSQNEEISLEKNPNITPETNDDPFGSILPSTEKLFSWALITLKFCLVIFAFLALMLEWRL